MSKCAFDLAELRHGIPRRCLWAANQANVVVHGVNAFAV